MLMAMSTMEVGKTTKRMALESIHTSMELVTRATGRRTNSMEKDSKLGPMVPATKDSTSKAENMVVVASHGLITARTLATLSTTTLKEKVRIHQTLIALRRL
jgi:hypothetical protein